jgi:hypothetical protein
MTDPPIGRRQIKRLRCPLCSHPRIHHLDGHAQQTLDTMGCASCESCERLRRALTERDSTPPRDDTRDDTRYGAKSVHSGGTGRAAQ